MTETAIKIDGMVQKNELHKSYDAEYIEVAEDLLIEAKELLLDINKWGQVAGIKDVLFSLTDQHQKDVNRKAHKGDFIKLVKDNTEIQWLHIEGIEYDDYPDENKESFSLCIAPAKLPYTPDTISADVITITVERINAKMFAYCKFSSAGLVETVLSENDWNLLLSALVNFD